MHGIPKYLISLKITIIPHSEKKSLMLIGDTFIIRKGKKKRSLLKGIKNPTPRPPVVMASNIPWDSVDKKIVKTHSNLFFLPIAKTKTKAHNKAKRIECVKPRWPKGCEYGIPKWNPITSISGIIVDKIAHKRSHLVLCLSKTFDMVNPTKPCPNIAIFTFFDIPNYSLFLLSIITVTGPSLMSSTFISAPN